MAADRLSRLEYPVHPVPIILALPEKTLAPRRILNGVTDTTSQIRHNSKDFRHVSSIRLLLGRLKVVQGAAKLPWNYTST
jgi:hypothetical protein